MGITASSKSDFQIEPIPSDTYVARCVGIYDIGTQHIEKFNKYVRKAIFQWEIPEVRLQYENEDGEKIDNPRVVSKEFTLSLHKKATLRQTLDAWRGKEFTAEELEGFDVMNVLSAPCMLQVVQKTKGDKVYSNVGVVTKVYKGVTVPKQELENRSFSFEDVSSYEEMAESLEELPEWIRNKIEQSKEYKALKERAVMGVRDEVTSMQNEVANEDDYDDEEPPF